MGRRQWPSKLIGNNERLRLQSSAADVGRRDPRGRARRVGARAAHHSATGTLSDEAGGIKEAFDGLDVEGNGTVSFEARRGHGIAWAW